MEIIKDIAEFCGSLAALYFSVMAGLAMWREDYEKVAAYAGLAILLKMH